MPGILPNDAPDLQITGVPASAMNVATRQPELFVVVLNWNGKEDLLECFGSLRGTTYPIQVILVDNGSKDNSVAEVRARFPEVSIIVNKTNVGFSGNNVGMEEALRRGADYVLLLNNDTWVEPHCFQELIRAAEENPEVGILSPRICYYSNPELIWYDGGKLDNVNGFLRHSHINSDRLTGSVDDRPMQLDYVCGCAMLIRRQVIEKIGALDKRFFMYWEDADFSLRARQAGFRLLHVPAATVLHKVSRSIGGFDSPDAYYYMERNRYFISKKRTSVSARMALIMAQIRNCFWEYCALMKMHRKEHALAIVEAAWDSLLGRGGKRRKKIPSILLAWLEYRRRRPKLSHQTTPSSK